MGKWHIILHHYKTQLIHGEFQLTLFYKHLWVKKKKRKGKPTQLQWKIMNCSKHFMNLFAVKLRKTMVKNLHHDLDKLQYWPRWSFLGKKEMSGEQTVFFESLLDISNQVVHRPLLFMLNPKDYEFKALIYSTQKKSI